MISELIYGLVCGALLGTQAGRDVEIHTAFEFLIEGSHIDHDFFRSRQTQCEYYKQNALMPTDLLFLR